ncbi:MAG: CpsB/CapC family capsule biosynthesis tyrosine phosphatase [Clostridia bacterium]
MIDMHSHFLPNVDDGAKNVPESLKMLSDSFEQGVLICAATPHCIIHKQEDLEKFLSERDNAFRVLTDEMKKTDCSYPEIILGGEVYLDNDLNVYEGLERVCYAGTDYLLLEFPTDKFNSRWPEWIYEMNRKGIKILVAHVDRYAHWKEMMSEFNGLDVKYQINASRFLNFSDRKLLKNLMAQGHRYIISSDMHNTKHRKSNMGEAYNKALKKYGDLTDKLFYENAKTVLKSGIH